ncbi:MAG: DUF5676 family membrane protein [Patescibacteria group bacterium]
MKLNKLALANAFAAVAIVYYIACVALIASMPGVYKMMMQSWMHGIDLSKSWMMRPSFNLVGVVTFVGLAWISGWVVAYFYNMFTAKK